MSTAAPSTAPRPFADIVSELIQRNHHDHEAARALAAENHRLQQHISMYDYRYSIAAVTDSPLAGTDWKNDCGVQSLLLLSASKYCRHYCERGCTQGWQRNLVLCSHPQEQTTPQLSSLRETAQ